MTKISDLRSWIRILNPGLNRPGSSSASGEVLPPTRPPKRRRLMPLTMILKISPPKTIFLKMHIHHHSTNLCRSSKILLHGSGVLTTQSSSQLNARKRKQVSDTSAPATLETSRSELIFPKFTHSPLRMFQIIDSDSDDASSCDNVSREVRKIGPFSTERQSNSDHSAALSEQK